MSNLYIYEGIEGITTSVPVNWSYSKSLGKISAPGALELSDVDGLNRIAEDIRDEWCSYIFSLSELFRKHDLQAEETDFYFISDLACKRTEFFPTYRDLCHVQLLRQKLMTASVDSVILHGCSPQFVDLVASAFPKSRIQVINLSQKKELRFPLLRNLVFFTLASAKLAIARFPKLPRRNVRRLYLTRFPLHLKPDLSEDKYVDLLGPEDMFLVNLLADGLHQNLGLRVYMKACTQLKASEGKKVVILDRYLRKRDILLVFLKGFAWRLRFQNLLRATYQFQGLELSAYIQEEIRFSMLRIPRLLIYRKAFQRLQSDWPCEELIYYLHEYPFGRAVTSFTKNLAFRRIGFQHGPASQRKLLYFMAPREGRSGPLPDEVWAEEEFSANIYRQAGYQNVHVLPKIPRLHYLNSVRRNPSSSEEILVACGLHDGLFLFQAIRKEAELNPHVRYLFKLHPRANSEQILREIAVARLQNVEVTRKNITDCLSTAHRVYVTYSSVGIEAHWLGIDVKVFRLPDRIDESPLTDPGFLALEGLQTNQV